MLVFAANILARGTGAAMKLHIERLRPSIEALPMIKTTPLPQTPPVPDTRNRTVDWLSLTPEEQKAILDWLRGCGVRATNQSRCLRPSALYGACMILIAAIVVLVLIVAGLLLGFSYIWFSMLREGLRTGDWS